MLFADLLQKIGDALGTWYILLPMILGLVALLVVFYFVRKKGGGD